MVLGAAGGRYRIRYKRHPAARPRVRWAGRRRAGPRNRRRPATAAARGGRGGRRAAIVPAAAHAQPLAPGIESHQRQHDHGHRLGRQGFGFGRLGNAEAVGDQRFARTPRREPQPVVVAEHRQAIADLSRQPHPATRAGRSRRPSPNSRRRGRRMGRTAAPTQARGQGFGGGDAGRGRQLPAAIAQRAAQGGAVVGHVVAVWCGHEGRQRKAGNEKPARGGLSFAFTAWMSRCGIRKKASSAIDDAC